MNVAALIGHGTVRGGRAAAATTAPRPTGELDAMKALVQEGMDAGCVGMSTGLVYVPGSYATTDEVVELASVVAASGGIYTSHIRNEGDELLDAVDEAIDIGRRAGLPVVISHLKATGSRQLGQGRRRPGSHRRRRPDGGRRPVPVHGRLDDPRGDHGERQGPRRPLRTRRAS